MPEYPVQISKVQAPPLRDETLARDRLLDWLSVKIHRRAVLLTAEAGYGKTTLLADFTRRTRLRVLWFRLDRGDRDWVGFIAYLVAAFRVHLPEFGPLTRGLLAETATTAPSLETVLEAFLRELAGVVGEPTAFVFDDFHLVDDSADVRHIVRELLTRAPERMAFVFASRREPPIRLARLRALGEVAELGTDDLRFDSTETERLFRETYAMRLEPSLLAELGRRTEGWAASLQLIRSALHDRDPSQVRSFISSLSGAEGHLYEYLAEEVIGELPDDLQQFLMRTSVLETVDLTLGPVAAGVTPDEAKRYMDSAERHGLLGRGGVRARHSVRAHPLVRDFLRARLGRAVEAAAVREIHLGVARAAYDIDWRTATVHFILAGAIGEAEQVLRTALDAVLATGAYATAQELVERLPDRELPGAAGLILRSRLAFQRGDRGEGVALAEEARSAEPESIAALMNLVHARHISGDVPGALAMNRLLAEVEASSLSRVGRAYRDAIDTSVSGSLPEASRTLLSVVNESARGAHSHFQGVALLNLALVQIAMGEGERALVSASEAVDWLSRTSSSIELVSSRLARAEALALLGRIDEARSEIELARESAGAGQTTELVAEIGWTESLFGEGSAVRPYIESEGRIPIVDNDAGEQAIFALALVRIADGDAHAALECLDRLRFGSPASTMAFDAQRYLLKGLTLALTGQEEALPFARRGADIARSQDANLYADYGSTMVALLDPNQDASRAVMFASKRRPVVLSMLAELITQHLATLSPEGGRAVADEAEQRPWRWRAPIRRAIEASDPEGRLRAAQILERIGESSDIARLRDLGRGARGRHSSRPGHELARRLAKPVSIDDLGRVRITRGSRTTEGHEVRRKVLALLCLLLTKPRFVLTRDEVLDRLWPDHDPDSALNSLNQTVYFLRRTLEPEYAEDLSPGYVGQDAETIWLDSELVDSSSRQCLAIIRSMPGEPTPEGALALSAAYRGRFALDFAYEEWAEAYREALHAGYLRVMEHAIRLDVDSGHLERGIFLAERAAEVDPDSDEIQLALTRLYWHSGAHAAAAEQYGHYARVMKDLGVEPLQLADL